VIGGLLVVAVVALLVTAYLAAVETVLTRLNVVRALRLAEEDERGAAALLWLAEHRASSLNVTLLLTVTARVVLAGAAAVIGFGLQAPAVAVPVALGLVIVSSLILGEIAPRTLALRYLEPTGLRLAGVTRGLVRALGPVATGVVKLGRALVPRRDEVSGPYASDDELRALDQDEAEQDDELEPEERAMIRSIFELADTIVREIMTPRPDMVTVPADAELRAVVATIIEHGFSRLPVHDPDDPDRIVGMVYAKDVLPLVADRADGAAPTRWAQIVRDPTFVPETKRCDELLRELQDGTVHLALVIDEYGELVGLVSIEDILEEIVGEIVDEHDHEEPLVEPLEDGVLRVDARLGVDDLNELLGTALPEEGWDTVGGLVFASFGRIPEVGDAVELEGVGLEVEQMQGRRVGKVLVTMRPVGTDEPGTDDVPVPDDVATAGARPESGSAT
jgi:CBS domain containing-hemolysin-like protein